MFRKLKSVKLKLVLPLAMLLMLLAANIEVVSAHRWGSVHWDKSGTRIEIKENHYGSTTAEAEAARMDKFIHIGILYNTLVSKHTEVTVFDGPAGPTTWSGRATIVDTNFDWDCWCWDHIAHAHAQYNSSEIHSPWVIQAIYCQEVFHTYGFDHDNTGGCMGYGYHNGSGNTINQHNADDFYNLYRNH